MTTAISVSAHTIEPGRYEALEGQRHQLSLSTHPVTFDRVKSFSSTTFAVGRGFAAFRRHDRACRIDARAPFRLLIAEIDAKWCAIFLDGANLRESDLPDFIEEDDPVITYLLNALCVRQAQLGSKSLESQALSEAIVRHLFRVNLSDVSVAAPLVSRLERVREFISANLGAAMDLNELAALAGMSRFEFARGFARAVGIPPHRYVMLQRVLAAGRLIRRDDVSLAEISLLCGFCDQSHMNRWIKRELGVAPLALRFA